MKAVILAGGKGTRLRPLTCGIPKPMVPLLDRPVMEYTIELLRRHEVTDIAVTMQHLPEVIRSYFGDGEDWGVQLTYWEEELPLGTAGGVKLAEAFLDETFVVVSGDALTDFDLQRALAFHRDKKSWATLLLAQVDVPLEFGVVMTEADGRISRFIEKPRWSEVFSDTVNTGIYILEPAALALVPAGQEFDFSKDLFPKLLELGRPIYGYAAQGYWSDIGSLAQYRQAQVDLLEGKVKAELRGMQREPGIWLEDGVKVSRDVKIEAPAYIGKNVVLEQGVRVGAYSVLGAGGIFRRHAVLERAVTWPCAVMEKGSELRGGLLGRQAALGAGAVVQEGAVIADGSIVGPNSSVQQGVQVWPGKRIGAGMRLAQTVKWGDAARQPLFGQWGIKGFPAGRMTVPFAAKLAMAIGSVWPAGVRVGIGRDAGCYSALLAEVLAAGLHASGLNTLHLEPGVSAITRLTVYEERLAGGIHVRQWADDGEMVIEVYDQEGLPLDGAMARKIEQAFLQEEMRRLPSEEAGRRFSFEDAANRYRERLFELIDIPAVCSMSYTLVLDTDQVLMEGICEDVFLRLGCRVIWRREAEEAAASITSGEPHSSMRAAVMNRQADLGAVLDRNGMLQELVTENGMPLEQEMIGILELYMQLHADEGPLYMPVYMPDHLEQIGLDHERTVVRTKSDWRTQMMNCRRGGFHFRFDGICMLVFLLDYMAKRSQRVSSLAGRRDGLVLAERQVDCPWSEKGRMMRMLLESLPESRVELTEGIKVFYDHGWALIVPDSDEPSFRIVVQDTTIEEAEERALLFASMIEAFQAKQEDRTGA